MGKGQNQAEGRGEGVDQMSVGDQFMKWQPLQFPSAVENRPLGAVSGRAVPIPSRAFEPSLRALISPHPALLNPWRDGLVCIWKLDTATQIALDVLKWKQRPEWSGFDVRSSQHQPDCWWEKLCFGAQDTPVGSRTLRCSLRQLWTRVHRNELCYTCDKVHTEIYTQSMKHYLQWKWFNTFYFNKENHSFTLHTQTST